MLEPCVPWLISLHLFEDVALQTCSSRKTDIFWHAEAVEWLFFTSPVSSGRAPMAFCSALISSTGPTFKEVPVSTIAWQLALQRLSWFPTSTLPESFKGQQQDRARRQDTCVYFQHKLFYHCSFHRKTLSHIGKSSFSQMWTVSLSNGE